MPEAKCSHWFPLESTVIKTCSLALIVISVGALTVWSVPSVTAAVSSTHVPASQAVAVSPNNLPAPQTLHTMPAPQEPFDSTPIGPTETVGASSLD